MGLYDRAFAWMMSHADAQQHDLYGARKRALFSDLRGTVVEVGPGSGVNLPYFPEGIRWIGVEPNPYMHAYIREKADEHGRTIELHAATLRELALPAASADAVVSTLVLCSVPEPQATLAEIRRVLRPGGRFLFIEHVAAPSGTLLRHVQRGIKPLWRLVADGCRPDRETGRLLDTAGFSDVRYESFELDVPLSIVRPHIVGVATAG